MTKIKLSQSALSKSSCMLNFYRTVVEGYTEIPSSNIVYGEAIHKFIDTMYKSHGHILTAREEALKVFSQPTEINRKSPHLGDKNHMITAAYNVWEMYIKADHELEIVELNGKPATEVTFDIPYYKDDFVDISLCGTIDTIGKIKGGCYVVRDWKTTSSWDTRSYFGQYEMSKQLRFYVFALKLMGKMYPDSILGQIGNTHIGAIIDGVFIKPAAIDIKCLRSEVFRITDEALDEFKVLLDNKIAEISYAVARRVYLKEGIINGTCIGKWGRCCFWNVCAAPANIAPILLERDFKKRNYNPLNYSGI